MSVAHIGINGPKRIPRAILLLATAALLSPHGGLGQKELPASPGWKSITNRAGWRISYPPNWRLGSCRSCPDPSDGGVSVSFTNESNQVQMMIDNLTREPDGAKDEDWLEEIARDTNLSEVVSKSTSPVAGAIALIVVNRAVDRTQSENVYLVRDRRTVAIRFDRSAPPDSSVRRAIATFEWLKPPAN